LNNSNENTNYLVTISVDAQTFFESSPASLQKKLDRCFDILKVSPRNYPNIKVLKGSLSGYYRYRVGDYRVYIPHSVHKRRTKKIRKAPMTKDNTGK